MIDDELRRDAHPFRAGRRALSRRAAGLFVPVARSWRVMKALRRRCLLHRAGGASNSLAPDSPVTAGRGQPSSAARGGPRSCRRHPTRRETERETRETRMENVSGGVPGQGVRGNPKNNKTLTRPRKTLRKTREHRPAVASRAGGVRALGTSLVTCCRVGVRDAVHSPCTSRTRRGREWCTGRCTRRSGRGDRC